MSRLVGLFNKMLGMKQCKGLVVRTSSRTDLGIFHLKFGRHVHVNEGLAVVWTLSRTNFGVFHLKFGTCKRGIIGTDLVKDRPWHNPSQIGCHKSGFVTNRLIFGSLNLVMSSTASYVSLCLPARICLFMTY